MPGTVAATKANLGISQANAAQQASGRKTIEPKTTIVSAPAPSGPIPGYWDRVAAEDAAAHRWEYQGPPAPAPVRTPADDKAQEEAAARINARFYAAQDAAARRVQAKADADARNQEYLEEVRAEAEEKRRALASEWAQDRAEQRAQVDADWAEMQANQRARQNENRLQEIERQQQRIEQEQRRLQQQQNLRR